ncbi:MAG: helix-turn-helix transcriptional regulator [Balneolaceae bacterium]|nr:helix-turn-helix transcriptional regulator [Balneolaceae bacterium]
MKYATGNRLKEIADALYGGNRSELARNLEMKPQALTKYLNGESMPGGLILIRMHGLGVNINWFLTGEGEMLREGPPHAISEPIGTYLARLEEEVLEEEEKEALGDLVDFSEAIREQDLSPGMQRAMLLVFARHLKSESAEE